MDDNELEIEEMGVELIETAIEHPCEDIFDIEPGTTMVEHSQRNTQMIQSEHYDTKDIEIEEQYQEIFDKCMDAFDDIQTEVEGIEGKYKARNNEVGVMFLTTALNAAKEKARMKEQKDKVVGNARDTSGSGSTVNNTQINISTSDLIKQFAIERNPTNNYTPDQNDVEQEEQEEQAESNKRKTTIRKKKEDKA